MASSAGTDLSWLPSDAEEQLSLGFRIISNAYKMRVNSLEAESRAMRAQNTEKTEQLAVMQKKHSTLEVQLIESTQRGNQLSEENKQLIATVKKLHKDINRLESLKKAVLNSIQEDHAEPDDGHSKIYTSDDVIQTAAPRTLQELHGLSDDLSIPWSSKFNSTDNLFLNSTTSNGGSTISPEGRVVDGKVFFRNARSRLSYEQFNNFLANIKKLNNNQQSREETLRTAQQIFGDPNSDLYEEFKLLLVRHS